MIVKNEQEMIEDCILSARNFVDEIIVVDTGSDDDTVRIAKKMGANVYTYEWDNSFSNARNCSIEKANHEWILLLDADERLVEEDGKKLIDFIENDKYDGAHFKVYNFVGSIESGRYTIHYALRLLRNNGMYRFCGDIHEQITSTQGELVKNRFAITEIRIKHLGYLDSVVSKKDKRARNIPMLEKELERKPDDPFTLFNLGNEYMADRDYKKALEFFSKALNGYNKNEGFAPHLVFRSAMCCYNLKMYRKAIEILNEGLSIYPKCTDMEFLKGLIYMETRRNTLALESFQRALVMGEAHPILRFTDGCGTTRPLISMAVIYERQEDYLNAAACYTKAVNLDGRLYIALYGVARCLRKLGQSPAEIEDVLARFFADPNYAPNRILLSDILLSQKFCEACEKHLNILDEICGYDGEKAFLRGKYCFYAKEYEKAFEYFSSVLDFSGDFRVFADARRESALLIFVTALIKDYEDTDGLRRVLDKAEMHLSRPAALICSQIINILEDREENLFEKEGAGELISFLSAVLKLVLESGEYELFEKLLYTYNYIDSPRVLLSLAEVYFECGLYNLAASAVFRSIKELNTIDSVGAAILADSLAFGN